MRKQLLFRVTVVLAVAGAGAGLLLLSAVLAHALRTRILMILWALVLIELTNLSLLFLLLLQDEHIINGFNGVMRQWEQDLTAVSAASHEKQEAYAIGARAENQQTSVKKEPEQQKAVPKRAENTKPQVKAVETPASEAPAGHKKQFPAAPGLPARLANASSLYYPEARPEFELCDEPADFELSGRSLTLSKKWLGRTLTPDQLRGSAWESVFRFETGYGVAAPSTGRFRLMSVKKPASVEALRLKECYRLTRKGTIIITMEDYSYD